MSAQLKTHLAVHCGDRTMIEKWLIGKRMFNFKFTVIQEPDLQRTALFLSFKLCKIFENFKTTFEYCLSNFCVTISFPANVSMFFFIPEYRSVEEKIGPKKHSGPSLLLVKILKKFLSILRMTKRFSWFYQSNLIEIGRREGGFLFQRWKKSG